MTAWSYVIPAAIGAVLMFLGQIATSLFNARTQRRQFSGDPGTVPGQEVYAEGQRLLNLYERDNQRLRQVENDYRKLADDYARLQRQYEILEHRCDTCPGRALKESANASS